MKNRKNNKGFSLVELIVVVAIMAVLVGVLAPAYLRYVEKSRLQKDDSAIAEVVEAIKIAAAEEECYDQIVTAGTTGVTVGTLAKTGWTQATLAAGNTDYVNQEINATVPSITFSSKEWKDSTSATYSIVVTSSDTGVTVTVTGAPANSQWN